MRNYLTSYVHLLDTTPPGDVAAAFRLWLEKAERWGVPPGERISHLLSHSPAPTFGQLRELMGEIDRLKRGDFTEEEFQNLCHNFSPDDRKRFKQGCREYQCKLFGPEG